MVYETSLKVNVGQAFLEMQIKTLFLLIKVVGSM